MKLAIILLFAVLLRAQPPQPKWSIGTAQIGSLKPHALRVKLKDAKVCWSADVRVWAKCSEPKPLIRWDSLAWHANDKPVNSWGPCCGFAPAGSLRPMPDLPQYEWYLDDALRMTQDPLFTAAALQ